MEYVISIVGSSFPTCYISSSSAGRALSRKASLTPGNTRVDQPLSFSCSSAALRFAKGCSLPNNRFFLPFAAWPTFKRGLPSSRELPRLPETSAEQWAIAIASVRSNDRTTPCLPRVFTIVYVSLRARWLKRTRDSSDLSQPSFHPEKSSGSKDLQRRSSTRIRFSDSHARARHRKPLVARSSFVSVTKKREREKEKRETRRRRETKQRILLCDRKWRTMIHRRPRGGRKPLVLEEQKFYGTRKPEEERPEPWTLELFASSSTKIR